MNAVGIICEYNPFHLGHARMLEGLRRQYDAPLVCAMSGNFVQRGDAAVARKHARGEMAVRCGADLVLELPTPWAMASAEMPAAAAVRGFIEAFSTRYGAFVHFARNARSARFSSIATLMSERRNGVSVPGRMGTHSQLPRAPSG